MKKNKISFGTTFWSASDAGNPFEAVEVFFDFAHLDYYKHILSKAVIYSHRRKIYKQDNPCEIFVFYTALCSFLKVCNYLKVKSKKCIAKRKATTDRIAVLLPEAIQLLETRLDNLIVELNATQPLFVEIYSNVLVLNS